MQLLRPRGPRALSHVNRQAPGLRFLKAQTSPCLKLQALQLVSISLAPSLNPLRFHLACFRAYKSIRGMVAGVLEGRCSFATMMAGLDHG